MLSNRLLPVRKRLRRLASEARLALSVQQPEKRINGTKDPGPERVLLKVLPGLAWDLVEGFGSHRRSSERSAALKKQSGIKGIAVCGAVHAREPLALGFPQNMG